MQVVYKYLATSGDITHLMLPKEAKILTVQKQGPYICFWALHASEGTTLESRRILKVGTGHSFDDTKKYEYIGTVQEMGGALIWHYFEVL
jgi:hypothetical protein